MAYTDAQFVMVNVKAIDQAFPLRGELRVQPAKKSIQSGEIWLSPRAMDLLKVKLGISSISPMRHLKSPPRLNRTPIRNLDFPDFRDR